MVNVVGIKFKNSGKLYYFAPREGDRYEKNMPVVVETARGMEYAWVAYPEKRVPDDEIVLPLKPIIRIATEEDTNTYESNLKKKQPAMQLCKERIAKHELDMKLIIRDSVKKYIVEKGTDTKYGARPLRRAMQTELEDKIAEAILNGEIARGMDVEVGILQKKIRFIQK